MNTTHARRRQRTVAVMAVATMVSAGCGSDDSADEPSATTTTGGGGQSALDLVASFYPLQFVAERVGGDRVSGDEPDPHRSRTARSGAHVTSDTVTLQDADLVVYLSGFTPALDDAVDIAGGDNAFDVAPAARPRPRGKPTKTTPTRRSTPTTRSRSRSTMASIHTSGSTRSRLADVADAVAERLGELDPENADEFAENAATVRGELEELDAEFDVGLADCATTDIVTSHTAFGYLAQRYGLTQVGIAGLSPEEEPSPARLAEVADFVTDHDVSTIYYETLVDPDIAETVAAETGAATAVLDPIEGLTDESAGSDYFEVMRIEPGELCAPAKTARDRPRRRVLPRRVEFGYRGAVVAARADLEIAPARSSPCWARTVRASRR